MLKIKKDDEVIVISGKDKGKRGRVVRVLPTVNRVIVENVNVVKRHTKPNPQMEKPGGIIEKEMPVHISNVQLINPVSGEPDRVGFKRLEDGKKVRVFKSNQEVLDN